MCVVKKIPDTTASLFRIKKSQMGTKFDKKGILL